MTTLLSRWLILILLSVLIAGPVDGSEPPYRTLAALDIGSGTTRLLVADVALCTGDILHIHEKASRRVSYAADLSHGNGNQFSPALHRRANAVMAELMSIADSYAPEQKLAVATQAFRQADNGDSLLDQWQSEFELETRILSQDEEARLAYRLVAKRLGHPARLMVWDIGAGSQQIVWRDSPDGGWHHFNSDIASVTLRDRAIKLLERAHDARTPNPLSIDEAQRLAEALKGWVDAEGIRRVSDFLADGAEIVGIGGVHGISLVQQLDLLPGEVLTRTAIQAQLLQQLERSDEEIGGSYADTEVTNLVLVGTLMDLFGIEHYRALPLDLTEALLLDHAMQCQE